MDGTRLAPIRLAPIRRSARAPAGRHGTARHGGGDVAPATGVCQAGADDLLPRRGALAGKGFTRREGGWVPGGAEIAAR